MGKAEEALKDFLKRRGLRVTRERLELARGLKEMRGHFSAEMLIRRLKGRKIRVSRDMVYRNLPVLLEAGMVRRCFRTSRDTIYERTDGRSHHDHLFCRRCGRVEEFTSARIERLQKKIALKKGFRLESHIHQLIGVCSRCRQKGK